jgi:lathosterol oxidase
MVGQNPARDGTWTLTAARIFGFINYFVLSTLSYIFIFDKRTLNHPKFIKNQIWLEIVQANKSMPFMALCTAPLMCLEVRGYSKLYDTTEQGPGIWYNFLQFPIFLVFTDFCIYWIHRYLHHPLIYKHLHKPHHKWISESTSRALSID